MLGRFLAFRRSLRPLFSGFWRSADPRGRVWLCSLRKRNVLGTGLLNPCWKLSQWFSLSVKTVLKANSVCYDSQPIERISQRFLSFIHMFRFSELLNCRPPHQALIAKIILKFLFDEQENHCGIKIPELIASISDNRSLNSNRRV